MNVIPMIRFKSNILHVLLTYTDIHTGSSDNIIYHIFL